MQPQDLRRSERIRLLAVALRYVATDTPQIHHERRALLADLINAAAGIAADDPQFGPAPDYKLDDAARRLGTIYEELYRLSDLLHRPSELRTTVNDLLLSLHIVPRYEPEFVTISRNLLLS